MRRRRKEQIQNSMKIHDRVSDGRMTLSNLITVLVSRAFYLLFRCRSGYNSISARHLRTIFSHTTRQFILLVVSQLPRYVALTFRHNSHTTNNDTSKPQSQIRSPCRRRNHRPRRSPRPEEPPLMPRDPTAPLPVPLHRLHRLQEQEQVLYYWRTASATADPSERRMPSLYVSA
jgi:hypothetical protein